MAERRARKVAVEQEREQTKGREAQRREEAAAFKARKNAFAKSIVSHEQQCDYAKRLEITWKQQESLLARAEDNFEKHALILKGPREKRPHAPVPPPAPPAGVAGAGEGDDDEEEPTTWALEELERLRTRLQTARRRAEAARDAYDKIAEQNAAAEEAIQREREEIEWIESLAAGITKRY